jgi:hypothetical protein
VTFNTLYGATSQKMVTFYGCENLKAYMKSDPEKFIITFR